MRISFLNKQSLELIMSIFPLNLKSDRVNFVAPSNPIECLLYLPNVWATQYKLGPERLTRLGNLNVHTATFPSR